jgi:hypothetical protein
MNKFNELTNTNHAVLVADYAAGGIMTACNGFVNWYAQRLGIVGISNWFNLKQSLEGIGKGNAWVVTNASKLPQPGDILKHAITHVDVALGFAGNILRRVAAGQGDGTIYSTHPRPRDAKTRAMEYDCLRRINGAGPYNYQRLEGWLDIDLFFGSGVAQNVPAPDWLVGWWRVTWRGMLYFYYFDRNYEARWTQMAPWSTEYPPLFASDIGDFTVDGFNTVTTTWRKTGSVEKFSLKYYSNSVEMRGTWNGTEPIAAIKM